MARSFPFLFISVGLSCDANPIVQHSSAQAQVHIDSVLAFTDTIGGGRVLVRTNKGRERKEITYNSKKRMPRTRTLTRGGPPAAGKYKLKIIPNSFALCRA